MDALFLTATEKEHFDALPAELREGWTVTDEISTAYESEKALRIRAAMARLAQQPELKPIVSALQSGKLAPDFRLPALSEAALSQFYFTIGARGVSALITRLLGDVRTDDDVQGLMVLSHIRHELLENNAAISYV